MFRRTLFALAAIALPAIAHAQNDSRWLLVGSDRDSTATFWIDTSRVVKTGMTVRLWVRTAHRDPKVKDERGRRIERSLILTEFWCSERKLWHQQAMVFFPNGDSESESLSSGWESPPPDTMLEAVLDAACKFQK